MLFYFSLCTIRLTCQNKEVKLHLKVTRIDLF